MNGFNTSQLKDQDLDSLIKEARKNRSTAIPVITPSGSQSYISLEVSKVKKGWAKVLVDIHHCNWDITKEGQNALPELLNRLPDPDDHRAPFCGKRVLQVEVKETGERIMLIGILTFLTQGQYLEKVEV